VVLPDQSAAGAASLGRRCSFASPGISSSHLKGRTMWTPSTSRYILITLFNSRGWNFKNACKDQAFAMMSKGDCAAAKGKFKAA
jgi:hypothetical protein